MHVGDTIVLGDRRSNITLNNMTEGKAYTVVEYDPNTASWPDGCSGDPFVTVFNDAGHKVELRASRFDKV